MKMEKIKRKPEMNNGKNKIEK